jgi:hypothetical protein
VLLTRSDGSHRTAIVHEEGMESGSDAGYDRMRNHMDVTAQIIFVESMRCRREIDL